MIGLELKSDSKSALKLPVSTKDIPTSALSFASLLQGIQDAGEKKTSPQNGAFILALQKGRVEQNATDTKDTKQTPSLHALLKGDEAKELQEELEVLALNPKLTQNRSISELKVLIQEAKQYLKNKITSLEGFQKSEIDALPKTLKGLTQVAQKLGLDLSKITLEEVQESAAGKTLKTAEMPKTAEVPKTSETPKSAEVAKTQTALNQNAEGNQKQVLPNPKAQAKTEIETEAKFAEFKPEQKVAAKAETQIEPKQVAIKPEQKSEDVKLKQTPLFQVQTKPTEITTQQLVSAKLSNSVEKNTKQKNENTLELLLRGEKALKHEGTATPDFSVATARVIAPSAKTQSQQNLESLLHGEVLSETQVKTETTHVAKAESFEVKVNEAKQMIRYLSQDVKQAIEDYKAPFTRVKVQLNPQNLGEVDLTVVQRGKNLHINLSSNNAAINTLAMHANDLKTQLNNNGIQNASLNFSNMSQGEQNSNGSHAHQQQHNRQNAKEQYGYFQIEDTKEEILSSLEIVVPHYA